MPYRLKIETFVGGEVRWTSSPFALSDSTEIPISDQSDSQPEKTLPDLLDYCPQLETAGRARLSGYGEAPLRRTSFTRKASSTIQRVARAVDQHSEKPQHILFFTGTIPGTGPEQYEAVAKWSSWMVHRLKAWIAKRVAAKLDFYCWELQKRGALHLHYALHVPDDGARFEIRSEIKSEWIRLLDEVSLRTGVDVYQNSVRGFSHKANKEVVQADCQEVEKGVGAYLGKYLSKAQTGKGSSSTFAPCRWWGASRPARELEESKRSRITMTFDSWHKWLCRIDDWKGILKTIAEDVFGWDNKVIAGEGGCAFDVDVDVLDEIINLHWGEHMTHAMHNAKVRDAWLGLATHLMEIEQRCPQWVKAMKNKHSSIAKWDIWINTPYRDVIDPRNMEMIQHVVWAFKDILIDPTNTWKPRLDWGLKNVLIMRLHEMNEILVEYYRFDYDDSQPQDG